MELKIERRAATLGMIQANGSLDVRRKLAKRQLAAPHTSFVEEIGEYILVTIEHYQFHRSNHALYRLLSILEAAHCAHFIKSTSVDGLAIYIQHQAESTRGRWIYQEIQKGLQPEQLVYSDPQRLIRISNSSTRNRAQVITQLFEQIKAQQLSVEILDLANQQGDITCCVSLVDVKEFKRSIMGILNIL